ncbi:MAG: hypothetical protein ACO1RX_13220 [Candidatus Sericytochromatia bacterium]
MVVPVVLGATVFNYEPLRQEQSRLAKTLVLPSPRDKDDTAVTLEIEDDQPTPFKYPTFIKVRYQRDGDLPLFELWTKDNFDQEYKVSKERRFDNLTQTYIDAAAPALGTTQPINDDPLVAAVNPISDVNNNYAVNPITGEIFRNAYWDEGARLIRDAGGLDPSNVNFAGDYIGTVKFDGVTGLALAAINTRVADISNAVEGITKVLSIVSGNLDQTLSLIK